MKQLSKLPRFAAATCWTVLSVACVAQTESNKQTPSRQSTAIAEAAERSNVEVTLERHAATVEVRVKSTVPFQDHAMPPILVIGDSAFGRSRHPADGDLNVLIFTIDADEYEALPDGAEVSIGYLSPSARLVPGERRSVTARPAAPRIQPSQVQSGRRRAGALNTRDLQVTP